MMINKRPVLILNADTTILSVTSLRKALGLYARDKAVVIRSDTSNGTGKMHPSLDFDGIPQVMALKHYKYVPFREIQLTRKRVFQRDKYRCQYCNKKLTGNTATVDHVIPRSHRDSPGNTWENLVCCCKPCNNEKSDRTPAQAGMVLKRRPFKPRVEHFFKIRPEWREFVTIPR